MDQTTFQSQNYLRVIDVSDPADPREVGSIATPGQAYGVHVVGELIYVADAWAGLSILRYTRS